MDEQLFKLGIEYYLHPRRVPLELLQPHQTAAKSIGHEVLYL